jgi:sortilin (neurotensin receptor 3)
MLNPLPSRIIFTIALSFLTLASQTLTSQGDVITRGLWVNVGPTARANDGSVSPVFVKDLAIDQVIHTIYLATIDSLKPERGGIFASSDSGKIWVQLFRGNCQQVVATGGSRVYALQAREQIIFSDDRGKSWTKCTRPRFQGNGFTGTAAIQAIAASPAAPKILYAGADGSGGGIYKSLDGGQTWLRPTRRATIVNRRDHSQIDFRDGAVYDIAVDPLDANLVIANFSGGFAASNDGGANFADCLSLGTGAGPAQRPAAAVKVVHGAGIQISPSAPNVIYLRNHTLSTQNEVYRSADGGHHWNRLANMPGNPAVLSLVAHPTNPRTVYAATDRGIFASSDAGLSWTPVQSADAPKSTGGFTIPSFFNGTAFNSVATVVNENEPFVIDPVTSHLFYGGYGVRILVGVR